MPRGKKTQGKKVAIIYHGGCLDGFGAAYAAWKKFGNRAEYHPITYTDKAPALRGKTVYLLDFMFGEDAPLKVLQKANAQVTAIDHHVSNKMRTMSTTDYRYALHNSGAVLAWQYFHPGKPVPQLLKYIEDHDIWAKKLPKTDEVHSFLSLQPFEFKTWDKLARIFEGKNSRREAVQAGILLKQYDNVLVGMIVSTSAIPVKFMGHAVYAANTPVLTSEVGHALYKDHPPFAIVWRQEGDLVRVSLRGNGSIDLTKFAQKFGGGGHHDACGFTVKADLNFPWKPIK